MISVGKDAAGRCCVAVGGGAPWGRASPHQAWPTVRSQTVPCRNRRYRARPAYFLSGPHIRREQVEWRPMWHVAPKNDVWREVYLAHVDV